MMTANEGDEASDDVLKAISTIVSATSKGKAPERTTVAPDHVTKAQITRTADVVVDRVKSEVERSIAPYRTLKETVAASDRNLRDFSEIIRRDIDRLDQLLVHLERAAREKRQGS